jgi:putative ATPase
MQCLPDNLRNRVYYEPTNEGAEKQLRQRLEEIRSRRSKVSKPKQPDSKTES